MGEVQHRMTPHRARWLRQLLEGPANRAKSRIGYDCMVLGWTRWAYRDKRRGDIINHAEARSRYGGKWFDEVDRAGETITQYGREALAAES